MPNWKLCISLISILVASLALPALADLGEFEGQSDIGKINLPGSAEYDAAKKEYRVTGSGENIWFKQDAFHYLWRKVSGDLSLTAGVTFVGQGKNAHRKACWMIRQSLDADSAYADVAVHGDGLISMQYRREAGGLTMEAQSPFRAPATVRLERDGDVITLSVAAKGKPFSPVGAVTVAMHDPVYAGLAVSSHEAAIAETAVFANVSLKATTLEPGKKRILQSSLEFVSIETGQRTLVYRAADRFEAPNWSQDGSLLYFNLRGGIYTISTTGGDPKKLDVTGVNRCNNDHGLSPDGKWLAISHQDRGPSVISIVPATGGAPRQITPLGPSYWHGWSPDGKTLAYCAQRNGNFDVYTIPAEGGEEKRLTDATGLDDGPEYTPDGKSIYFNSERTGQMHVWRMNADGTNQEQITTDPQYADWFPHPSPDGKWLLILSYSKDVKGHPENQDVVLRLLPLAGGKPRILATLFGGQGTVNVPSWSPDSKIVAFVSYRLVVP